MSTTIRPNSTISADVDWIPIGAATIWEALSDTPALPSDTSLVLAQSDFPLNASFVVGLGTFTKTGGMVISNIELYVDGANGSSYSTPYDVVFTLRKASGGTTLVVVTINSATPVTTSNNLASTDLTQGELDGLEIRCNFNATVDAGLGTQVYGLWVVITESAGGGGGSNPTKLLYDTISGRKTLFSLNGGREFIGF